MVFVGYVGHILKTTPIGSENVDDFWQENEKQPHHQKNVWQRCHGEYLKLARLL